jgi:hypothetical protein
VSATHILLEVKVGAIDWYSSALHVVNPRQIASDVDVAGEAKYCAGEQVVMDEHTRLEVADGAID